jgi:hypothetical protein
MTREIMLFIGNPKGRSKMISNVDDYKVVATWYLAYHTGA